ncbi:MAG TPA: NlpC/P60 family protein [Blastocatellia bacterium]|jgi:NlpC/P60 family|nr:NlpC/P60 family protein [Blastocatellia bacterium]
MTRPASRRILSQSLTALALLGAWQAAPAQPRPGDGAELPAAGRRAREFARLLLPSAAPGGYARFAAPFIFPGPGLTFLETAIAAKLGVRYRFYGTDDRGYDCSGFVWRVFDEAGTGFAHLPARDLWWQFPAATAEESRQFGTLVFFNGLRHVGIVRDAFTFYHASSSRGVVLSRFTGYWERRITGFRRPPLAPPPPR